MAKQHLQPTLLSTAIAAGLAAATMPAHALSLGISGQINKQLSSVDNGNDSALAVMDNSNSGSRFRFTGEEDIGGGLKVGGVWEWQWQNTSSSGAEFNAVGEIDERTASLSDRKTELYFAAKWGKVSLGKGDGAGNGAAEVDLSGTTVIDYCGGNSDQLGSFDFTTSAGGLSGVDVGDVAGCNDMFSRNNRIRYDTPKLAKWLTISVSRAQANLTEVAVRASGTVGSTRIAAAVATGTAKDEGVPGNNPDDTRTAISGSVLLKNGLNFTASVSSQEVEGVGGSPDSENTWSYFKIGYKTGKHAVSLAAGQKKFEGQGAVVDATDPTSVALAYVYKIAKDVELYAAYRDVDADRTGLDGVSSLTVGSRIKWK
jgi:predicted porin